jgi:hypothetical protein
MWAPLATCQGCCGIAGEDSDRKFSKSDEHSHIFQPTHYISWKGGNKNLPTFVAARETGGLLRLATINTAEKSEERWSWVTLCDYLAFFLWANVADDHRSVFLFDGRVGRVLTETRYDDWFRPHNKCLSENSIPKSFHEIIYCMFSHQTSYFILICFQPHPNVVSKRVGMLRFRND